MNLATVQVHFVADILRRAGFLLNISNVGGQRGSGIGHNDK
jgi:hypothetical protein